MWHAHGFTTRKLHSMPEKKLGSGHQTKGTFVQQFVNKVVSRKKKVRYLLTKILKNKQSFKKNVVISKVNTWEWWPIFQASSHT